MFKEQQLLKQKEMKLELDEVSKHNLQTLNCRVMEDFLKYEFPLMYEKEPELIWMFTMEYTDSHFNGFEPSEDLMCHIQNRLMKWHKTDEVL
jgi:hypothetical protein